MLTLHYSNILKYSKPLAFGWPVISWYVITATAIAEVPFTISYVAIVGHKALGTNYWTITDDKKVIIIGYRSLGWVWNHLDGTILSYFYKDEKKVVWGG